MDVPVTGSRGGAGTIEQGTRRSLVARSSQLLVTTALALVAIVGSIVVCELTRKD